MIRERSDSERPLFQVNGPRFTSEQRRIAAHNRALITSWFRRQFDTAEAILDAHHALHAQHWWALKSYPLDTADDHAALVSSHRSQYALLGALELLRAGHAGASGPILRYVFESQCIGKFARTHSDSGLAAKWMRGESIYFANGILKRIPVRHAEPLRHFWTTLNAEAHATRGSLQMSPYAEDNRDRIEAALAVLSMLLALEFHMLANHTYAPPLKAYVRQLEARSEIAGLLVEARRLHKKASSQQSAAARTVVRAFAGRWVDASSSA